MTQLECSQSVRDIDDTRVRLLGLVVGRVLVTMILVLAVSACSEDRETTLRLTGRVQLCASTTICSSFPAAGAQVEVLGEQGVVAEGVLDDDGTASFRVEPGRYGARLALPDLDLETSTSPLDGLALREGESGELDLTFDPVVQR